MKKLLPLIILAASLATAALYAADFPIRVQAQVDRREIVLGDVMEYKLTLEYPKDYKLNLPDLTSIFGNFEIKKQKNIPPKTIGGFFSARRNFAEFTYSITNFNIGEQSISSFTASFTLPSGEIKEGTVPEIIIKVNPVKENSGDGQDIRDIKPPLSLGINKLLIFTLLLFLAVGIYLYFLQKKQEVAPEAGEAFEEAEVPPEETANKLLDELLAKNLVMEGRIKEFYIELSDIIRRYLSAKYGVPVIERTTDEVCRDLKKTGVVERKRQAEIKEFLDNCDMVKFAKYIPVENEINADVEKARGIIRI